MPRTQRDPKPFFCSVSEGELRSLALQFLWGGKKLEKMEFALGYFRRVPIEQSNVMKTYAVIDAYSKSKGIKMGKNDLWIAAVALTTDARLITTDPDFDHLDPDFISIDRVKLQ
jgi:tRNA(fMet)-specific endonuclease VapC